MMKNAFFATLLMYAVSAVLFALFLVPAGLLVLMLPGQLSAMTLVFALLFAWAAKAALLEPLALVCMMQAYFKVIDGQQPDPVWDQRLTQMSGKFGKIKQQAIDWVPQPSAAAAATATPAPATQSGGSEG
jgi:membrane protein implicated in regulation of membrane protease activity